jgi:8-oxo-dGTP pyrophosphatase MutT (NUDIX family)
VADEDPNNRGADRSARPAAEPIPAATAVLVRDGSTGVEVLMLRRSGELAFAAGKWVFPGGRVDPEDLGNGLDPVAAGARAAVREIAEETGLVVDGSDFVLMSRWVPPKQAPKRFFTYFFAGRAPEGEIVVDGGEIHDHTWVSPTAALEGHERGELDLMPPTWVTLYHLRSFATVAEMLAALAERPAPLYESNFVKHGETMIGMWEGDAGWVTGDHTLPGPRHRLMTGPGAWRFELHLDS